MSEQRKEHYGKILLELNKAELNLPTPEFHQLLEGIYTKITQIAQSRNALAQQKAYFEQTENQTEQ